MIYILPVALRCGIHLMHDADMRKLLLGAVPPVPSCAVGGTLGEGVQRFKVFPVGEADYHAPGVGCCAFHYCTSS